MQMEHGQSEHRTVPSPGVEAYFSRRSTVASEQDDHSQGLVEDRTPREVRVGSQAVGEGSRGIEDGHGGQCEDQDRPYPLRPCQRVIRAIPAEGEGPCCEAGIHNPFQRLHLVQAGLAEPPRDLSPVFLVRAYVCRPDIAGDMVLDVFWFPAPSHDLFRVRGLLVVAEKAMRVLRGRGGEVQFLLQIFSRLAARLTRQRSRRHISRALSPSRAHVHHGPCSDPSMTLPESGWKNSKTQAGAEDRILASYSRDLVLSPGRGSVPSGLASFPFPCDRSQVPRGF